MLEEGRGCDGWEGDERRDVKSGMKTQRADIMVPRKGIKHFSANLREIEDVPRQLRHKDREGNGRNQSPSHVWGDGPCGDIVSTVVSAAYPPAMARRLQLDSTQTMVFLQLLRTAT